MFTETRVANAGMEFTGVGVDISRSKETQSVFFKVSLTAGEFPNLHKHDIHISLSESEADTVLDELIEQLSVQRELLRNSEVDADA